MNNNAPLAYVLICRISSQDPTNAMKSILLEDVQCINGYRYKDRAYVQKLRDNHAVGYCKWTSPYYYLSDEQWKEYTALPAKYDIQTTSNYVYAYPEEFREQLPILVEAIDRYSKSGTGKDYHIIRTLIQTEWIRIWNKLWDEKILPRIYDIGIVYGEPIDTDPRLQSYSTRGIAL